MQVKGRWLLGLCGLALGIPGVVMADQPGDAQAPAAVGAPDAPDQSPHRHHHHWTVFGRRHCVECQRAYVKAHDGVDVPAPPPLEPGAMPAPAGALASKPCVTCEGSTVVSGPMMSANSPAPGYAVVGPGAPAMASASAPGYAVVGGEVVTGMDPAPIGMYRGGLSSAGGAQTAAAGPRPGAGPYDPAVVPTNIPPGQVALAGPSSDRPHIISHLLGLPRLGQLRRQAEEKEREKHAAISYDQPNQTVTELPASMVYGNNNGKSSK